MKTYFEKTYPTVSTASLARAITWAGSKQTYFTARLLVDKDLVDDCYRAYAYFRWADDVIDDSTRSSEERLNFINRQKRLIEQSYRNEKPLDMLPEEEIVADLISHDRRENQGLVSFIHNFLAILEFDAHRRGRLIGSEELTWYSSRLAEAVTDGIQYFVGNNHPYPITDNRYQAVFAAHVTHMLRDMVPDVEEGYINIPEEYLKAHNITPDEVNNPKLRAWVRERVQLARRCLCQGKQYLEELEVLRCKVAGFWYCVRYEGVLDAIERDNYVLRKAYRRSPFAWFRIAWIGVIVTLKHFTRKVLARRQRRRAFVRKISDWDSDLVIPKHQKGVLKR